jgi:hypothetical protein
VAANDRVGQRRGTASSNSLPSSGESGANPTCTDGRGVSSEDDPHAMGRAVLCQRDSYLISGQRLAVELRTGDPTTDPMGVLDHDFVARRGVLKHDFEARPMLGNARREEQECSLKPKAKNRFDTLSFLGQYVLRSGSSEPGPT